MFRKLTTLAMTCGFAAAMLAGCGGGSGGGGTITPPVSKPPTSGQTGTVKFTFHINKQHGSALRGRKYTSRNTAGLGISWRVNGSGTAFPSTLAQLQSPMFVTQISSAYTSNNVTCGTADSSGAFTCSVLIPLPVGYDDFQITTWDQAPATLGTNNDGFGGTFAASANDLSTNTLFGELIVQNQTNTITFTLNGVVASVSLSLAPNTLVSGGSGTQTTTLNVLALDADGNIIIGTDPYVDNAGNPVTITVNKAESDPSPPTGGTPPANGNVTFDATDSNCTATQCTFTDPTISSDTVDYDNFETNSATFSATTTNTVPSVNATLGFTNTTNGGTIGAAGSPTMNSTAITQGTSIAAGAYGDPNLYIADSADQRIIQMTPGQPPVYAYWYSDNPGAIVSWNRLVVGPDSAVWVTGAGTDANSAGGQIDQFDLKSGVGPLWNSFNSDPNNFINSPLIVAPYGITVGPDGKMWVSDPGSNTVYSISIPPGDEYSGASYVFTAATGTFSANAGLRDIVSDGANLWVAEANTGKVAEVTTAGAVTEYAVSGASQLSSIAYGPDGNIWVTDATANKVFQISDQSGTVGNLLKTISLSGTPNQITAAAGALYVTETSATANLVAKIAISGAMSEYTNGLPGVANPLGGIAIGSDGQIYMTESTGSNVVYFQP